MMSMRARIEVRVPMLDDTMVWQGLRLPHRMKTDGRQGKLVLRAIARRWLPPDVAAHKKQGFSIPLDRMVGPAFHDMLAELLLSPEARIRTFLDTRLVDLWVKWFRGAREGRRTGPHSRGGLYQRIFILLALEIWLRERRLAW
jgi:asparagine synthase (glutamine-hydrolysing)